MIAVEFQMLRRHDIRGSQLAVLERQFGPFIPAPIQSSDDVMTWAFDTMSPRRMAMVLAPWIDRAFATAVVDDLERVNLVRDILAGAVTDAGRISRCAQDLTELGHTLLRVRGLGRIDVDVQREDPRIQKDVHAWFAASSAALALAVPTRSPARASAAHGALRWTALQAEPLVQPSVIDQCVRDTVDGLADEVSRFWVRPALA